MPQLTLRPNAAGTGQGNAQHSKNTGQANWEHCDEVTADDAATYVYNNTTSVTPVLLGDRYNLQDHGGQLGKITKVTIWFRARYSMLNGTAKARTQILSGTIYSGSFQDLTNTWANYSTEYANHPGGGSWTWAQVNSLQAGFHSETVGNGSSATQAEITQVWVVVDYDDAFQPSGGPTATVNASQPAFTLSDAFHPSGGPLVTVNAPQPAFILGQPPVPGTPFVATVRVAGPFMHESSLGDFAVTTRAVDFMREDTL